MTRIIIFTIAFLCVFISTPTFAGRFTGKALRIDTHIGTELSPINDNIQDLPLLIKDDTFQIELFVEGGRGGRTRAITLTFDNLNNNFGEFFTIVRIDGILPQSEAPGPTTVKACADFPVVIPPNDYFATVTLRVKKDLLTGQSLRFHTTKTTIQDHNAQLHDILSVGNASVTFGRPDYNLLLDLNTAPGNQNQIEASGLNIGTPIRVQVFGERIRFMTGFILRFEYDHTQLTFNTFEPSTIFPNSQTLAPIQTEIDSLISEVEVTAASFGNSTEVENGLLGTLTFTPNESFSITGLVMSSAELRRGGTFNPFFTPLSIELARLDADFDEDGVVDFHDFILFAERFGSKRGDLMYSEEFDLVPDSAINFADFLLFTQGFTTFRVTVID